MFEPVIGELKNGWCTANGFLKEEVKCMGNVGIILAPTSRNVQLLKQF